MMEAEQIAKGLERQFTSLEKRNHDLMSMVTELAAKNTDLEAQLEEARTRAIEECAQIADPPLAHRKGRIGLWRQRRAQIAADIRALKETP